MNNDLPIKEAAPNEAQGTLPANTPPLASLESGGPPPGEPRLPGGPHPASPAPASAEEPPHPSGEPRLAAPAPETLLAPHDPGVHLVSKRRWRWIGIAIAILNPIFSGLLIGAYFLKEPEMRREGKIVTIVALGWGTALFVLLWLARNRIAP